MERIRSLIENRHPFFWQDVAACFAVHAFLYLLILTGLFPALRVVVSLLCLLFTPGYATLALFFPRTKDIDLTARLGLSPIVSTVMLILIGLILNYSPWGLSLDVVLASVTGYVALCGLAACWMRSGIPPEEQYGSSFRIAVRDSRKWVPATVIITVALVAVWGYFEGVVAQNTGDRYTEFYLLGADGAADQYPQQAVAGEPITVIVGIVNQEHAPVTYHVLLRETDGSLQRLATVTLDEGESWEQACTFSLTVVGEKNRVTFLLYREGDTEPYRSLQLWVTVTEKPAATHAD